MDLPTTEIIEPIYLDNKVDNFDARGVRHTVVTIEIMKAIGMPLNHASNKIGRIPMARKANKKDRSVAINKQTGILEIRIYLNVPDLQVKYSEAKYAPKGTAGIMRPTTKDATKA
ncbi:hypothetical protein SRA_02961 [Streptococcus ratti FA-1 = DSM 20564]|uniref:Uncharacterized protein n=1 Tax=Streptococcus ratti FA-1 = DSM 20564 TaxID=699248 RepID=A0ABN0GSU1_STRRT|nr:hypothetical protein [Streptococcus ratti]EJN93462.1 hypothetical protein SRA_02961 [Streptococcus ratti FA-1 = DSM 20564]